MSFLTFDPDNTLAGGLFAVTGREAISLGRDLCAAVERAVGADGVHGGVWPGNITWTDGQVAVGPKGSGSIPDLSPDALEYVAPEQFWMGTSTPATDVYSIGLVLYTALNKGVKPYFSGTEDNSPESRADAMQNRMKGAPLPYPSTASRALGDVVLKAIAFQAADRYATPGKLRAALDALPSGAEVPAENPVVHLTEAERQNAPSYRVDKEIEKDPQPARGKRAKRQKKRSGNTDRLSALALDQESGKTEQVVHTLVTGQVPADHSPDRAPQPEPARTPPPPPEPPAAAMEETAVFQTVPEEPAPQQKTRPKHREKGEVDENMDAEEFRAGKQPRHWTKLIVPLLLLAVIAVAVFLLLRGCRNEEGEFVLPFAAAPTPTQTIDPLDSIHAPVPEETLLPAPPAVTETPEPTPTPTPEPTEPPGPSYELFLADVSWTQARDLCEQKGGHLATVRNDEQLQQIIDLAVANGAQFIWLGAFRGDSSTWYYVTGERMDYALWDDGEPSAIDMDGTREDYLLLWYRANKGRWCYNDQRNDPVSLLPATYSGKTAYICQYDG